MVRTKVAKWNWSLGNNKTFVYTGLHVTEEQIKDWLKEGTHPKAVGYKFINTLCREVKFIDLPNKLFVEFEMK